MSGRRRLAAVLCIVALLGAALAVHDANNPWAPAPLAPVLPGTVVVLFLLPSADSSPPAALFARDAGSRAPPLA